MDRNQPLIGGRLELENAPAFARQVRAIERSMKSLNQTMEKSSAEGLGRRLTAISKGYDRLAQSAGAAAVGLAAVNMQSAQLGRSALAINRLTRSMASLNKAGGSASLSNALSIIANGGGGGGARVSGGSSARGTLTSSPLKLDAQQALIRRQNAGIIDANMAAARERKAALDEIWRKEVAAGAARYQLGVAARRKQINDLIAERKREAVRLARVIPQFRTTPGIAQSAIMGAATYKSSPLHLARMRQEQLKASRDATREAIRAAAEETRLLRERDRIEERLRRDAIRSAEQRARQQSRQSFRGRGGGRGITGLGAGAAGFGGNRGRSGGASRPTDLVPGLGLGSTAYFRGNVGPAAIYTRMPLTMTAIGAATAIATAAVVALGSAFEKTATSAKVFGGLDTPVELKRITDQAINMSRQFSTSAGDVVKGATVLGKAGAPIQGLNNELVRTTVLFARASDGELETAEAAKILTQTIKAQGLSWNDAMKVADDYTGVVQNSSLEFSDLDNILTQLIPVGTQLGYTYKDMAVATALLTDTGVGATVAGTALKNMFLRLADPTEESLELMKQYGISLFDANKKALPLPEVIGRLFNAFGKGGEQGALDAQRFFDIADIGTTRTILAIANLSNSGADAFYDLARRAEVSTEDIARALDRNLIKQLDIVGNQIEAAGIRISQGFGDTLTNVALTANESLRSIGDDGFRELGNSINRVITLQDEFAAALFQAGAPTVIAGYLSLKDTLKDIGDNLVDSKDEAIGFVGAMSDGVLLATILFGHLRNAILDVDKTSAEAASAELKRIAQVRAAQIEAITAVLAAPQAIGKFIGERLNNRPIRADGSKGAPGTGSFLDIEGFRDEFEFPVKSLQENFIELQNDWRETLGATAEGAAGVISSVEGAVTGSTNPLINHIRQITAEWRVLKAEIASTSAQAAEDYGRTSVFGPMTGEGFWRDGMPPITLTKPVRGRPPPFIPSGGSTLPAAGGGGGSGPTIDDFAKQIKALLSDVPGLTDELFQFLGGLAHDLPARLLPMVGALKESRVQIGGIINARRSLLQIDMQLLGSAKNLANLQGEMGRLEIEQAIAVLGYDRQLLGLKHQLLVIDQQMQPLHDAQLMIDRQISKLQEENLNLARQRLSVETEMLPIQREIEILDEKIAKLGRVDYGLAQARLQIELSLLGPRQQLVAIDERIAELSKRNFDTERAAIALEMAALPLRRAIRDIEDQITRSVDKRAGIQKSLRELDLADSQDELAAAWAAMDVEAILALEAKTKQIEESLKGDEKAERAAERKRLGLELEKIGLEEQLDPILKRIQLQEDAAEQAALNNSLTLIGLEAERLAIEEVIIRAEKRLATIDQQIEKQRILDEIERLGYEAERQRLLDILAPLAEKLAAINFEIATENLRNQLALLHLEEESRKIRELLIPLEDQRRAIERNMQQIDLLRASAVLEFEERKIQLQAMILDEQLRQAELEATRRQQELLFAEMVQGFIDSLVSSEAFTAGEAVEVAKRGKLWDEQIADIIESRVELDRVSEAAKAYGYALDESLRDRTMTITTRYVTEGAPTAGAGGGSSAGGVGATGGSEIGVVNAGMRAAQTMGGTTVNNISNFNVDANYANVQSPAAVRDDIRALIMLTSRG